MMRSNEETKFAKTRNALCDAQIASSSMSPRELVFAAIDAAELASEFLNDALIELQRREVARVGRSRVTLQEIAPYNLLKKQLRLMERRQRDQWIDLQKTERTVLQDLSFFGEVESYSGEKKSKLTDDERATAEALDLTEEQYLCARDAADMRFQFGAYEALFEVQYVGDPQREHATMVTVTRLRDGETCSLQCGEFDDGKHLPGSIERAIERKLETLPHRHLY